MTVKPKVLVVGPVPPPVGGVETQISTLLESPLRERFDLVHCNTSKARPKQTQGKFDVGNIVWALRHFRRLRADIREHKPDVVYMPVSSTHAGFLRDAVFAVIVNRHRRLLVGHVHGGDFDRLYATVSRPFQRVIVRTLNRCDVVCALGTMWEKLFRSVGVRSAVRIVPPTSYRVVFERGETVVRSPDGPSGKNGQPVTILFVGQVGRRKGAFDILAAAESIRQRAPTSRLLMVGPDEFAGEWEQVMAEVDRRGLKDYIEFTGPLQGEDLLAAYARGDLLLLPSYHEGFPAVLIEAGAFGAPVVTTPVGAVRDYVTDGENGYFVEPGNPDQIADRVVELCNDSLKRYQMGMCNRERARAYHPDSIAASVGDAIQLALDLPPQRRALGKRPRVLLVGPIPPPVGGVESVTRCLLDSDLRSDFDVIHCDTSRRQTKEHVSRLTLLNVLWATFYSLRYTYLVLRHMPHIVHIPMVSLRLPFIRDAGLTLFGRLCRRKVVLHSHDGYLPEVYGRAGPLWRKLMIWIFNRSERLVTLTDSWKRFFEERGVTRPIDVVHNPLDDMFGDVTSYRTTNQNRPWTVLFVGAICRDKGVPDLLEAAKRVLEVRPDIRFRLVGPGRFVGEWAAMVRERGRLGLDEFVEMPGSLQGADLLRAYADADCFVLPTYKEGMPVVLLEAMAAGLVLITTDVGGILDLVEDGVNGFVLRPGDVDGLTSRILAIAQDPEKYRWMGEENRRKVLSHYMAHAVAEQMAEVYRRVLQQ